MSETVTQQLAEIDAIVNGAEAPALKPTTAPRSVKPAAIKPRQVVAKGTDPGWEDGDDGDDNAPSAIGARVTGSRKDKPANAEPKPTVIATPDEIVLGSHGFPLIEELAEVKQAVANEARIRAQLADERKHVDDSVRAMGLEPGKLRPDFVEKLAAQWLVEGKPLDVIEKFEVHVRHAKRLEAALVLATNAKNNAREVGIRRLLPAANEGLRETFVAMHRKRVELARALEEHQTSMRRQEAAGFPRGHGFWGVNPTVPTEPLVAATHFGDLVKQGILTPEDVAGIPGIQSQTTG